MVIPSEEQISAVLSEIQASAVTEHETPETHTCDFCEINKEFDKRGINSNEKGGELPSIDNLVLNSASTVPILGIVAVSDPNIMRAMMITARLAFLTGLKVGRNQEATKQLQDLMDLG